MKNFENDECYVDIKKYKNSREYEKTKLQEYKMNQLLNKIFEIQDKINKVTFPKYEGMDQGMFLPQDQESPDVFWRDNSYWNDEKTVYSFCFSTNGEYQGDLPPDCALEILTILESYKN